MDETREGIWIKVHRYDKKKDEYIKTECRIDPEDFDEAYTFADKLSRRSQLKFEREMEAKGKNIISPQRLKYLTELE